MPLPGGRGSQGRAAAARKGYVLFAVLLVTVVLSLTAYRFTDSMVTENTVAVRSTEQVQARLSAVSGIAHAAGILADPEMMSGQLAFDVSDNAELFSGRTVGEDGRSRFSLINLSEALDGAGSGEARYPLRYGIEDEGGKININGLILKDPTGTVLFAALMTLQNQGMTQQIADSIVDWVDADSTTRPEGAENDYYAGMQTPYLCKNGPLNSVDELLLVQGVTSALLYGNDRNRNGKLDAAEDDGNEFGRGWSEYLTCYGREINVDSAGLPRLNLNGTDIVVLSEQLTALVGQEVADYIIYYRIKGGTAFNPNLPSGQVAAPVTQLRDLVQKAVEAKQPLSRRVSSVITIVNTQIALDRPPASFTFGPGGATVVMPPQPIVASPINDPAALEKILTTLLDKCTTEDGFEIPPRINVNSAPLSVLAALPGMTETDVNTIVSSRGGQSLTDPTVNTGAWLVTVAKMPPDKFKQLEPYISGRTWTYRVHSVGYSGPAAGSVGAGGRRGPVARVEAVIDVGSRTTDGTFTGLPRIVYFRDLTDLGRGFADLPGSQ